MLNTLQGTESAKDAIATVNYTHDAMIDLMLANPKISQNELAKQFGFTAAWVSRIMNSDAFLERLASRKQELSDPLIAQTIDEKLNMLTGQSLEILSERLAATRNPDLALKVLPEVLKATKGYGARGPVVNNSFVVALPGKATNSAEWMQATVGAVQVIEGKEFGVEE